MLPVIAHATRALINCAAFIHNLHVVRSLIGPTGKIMAVVKADAYGHGTPDLARIAGAEGADYLGIARVSEGVQLREAGIHTPILLFEATPPEHEAIALRHHLDLTVVSLAQAERLDDLSQRLGNKAALQVKVDTGMGRLGIRAEEAADVIERIALLRHVDLTGVYSHFSTAEDADPAYARAQLECFLSVLENVRRRGIEIPLRHMANSAAIMTMPDAHLDLVRPGLMLYGYAPHRRLKTNPPLRPVMALITRVAFVKTVPEGTSISYGRRYVTAQRTKIATIPVGYGDGFSRMFTNRGDVLIRGRRYRVAGTVCMDQTMLDIGLDSDVAEGDLVTLLGRDGAEEISAWDLADLMGTIPYEVTSLITPRVPRVFFGHM